MNRKSKTKIICTIGPSTKKKETIVSLVENGMSVARLNFSHGTYNEHNELISNIKEAARQSDIIIPIIGDLGGPKVRIGKIDGTITLEKDEIVTIARQGTSSSCIKRLPINYDNLDNDVENGDRVLIDDGLIELIITEKKADAIYCRVLEGGTVKSDKGVNFPDTSLSTPSLTDKDKEDIEFALDKRLDFFALSFVRNSKDIHELRTYLSDRESDIPIIAKIEKPQAIQDIEQIIKTSDMIMIARGDLGVEMDAFEVPILQKEIIRKCLTHNKPVITATQMLESMINNPRSTRAEASDVANAVFDGTYVVMLSGETSIGSHPVAAVKVMHSILVRAEQTEYIVPDLYNLNNMSNNSKFANELSKAACRVAKETHASAIIAMTRTGRTARYLAKYRTHTPIIAFSPYEKTVTNLSLTWGVEAVTIDAFGKIDETLEQAKKLAVDRGYIEKGDVIILVAGNPLVETEEINMIKIENV